MVPFRDQHYSPEKLAVMYRVLDECVAVVTDGHSQPDQRTLDGIRTRLAQLILGAVAEGEEDPAALKEAALRSFRRVGS